MKVWMQEELDLMVGGVGGGWGGEAFSSLVSMHRVESVGSM